MLNLSFIIPLRIDSNDRLKNCETVIRFLSKYFPESEIVVIENGENSNIKNLLKENSEIKYYFIHNTDRFSKANTINFGLLKTDKKYVAIYDVDVLIKPEAVFKGLGILQTGKKVVIPHNLKYVNVKGALKDKIFETLDFSFIKHYFIWEKSKDAELEVFPYRLPSGVVLFDKKTLIENGGYNKKMVSYGWEDIEVLKRLKKLGYPQYNLGWYHIIHLDHERRKDSQQNEYFENNKVEFNRVLSISKKELKLYIEKYLKIN